MEAGASPVEKVIRRYTPICVFRAAKYAFELPTSFVILMQVLVKKWMPWVVDETLTYAESSLDRCSKPTIDRCEETLVSFTHEAGRE